MRKESLQNQYTTGRFTLPVVYFIGILCWVISALLTPNSYYPFSSNNPIWNLIQWEYTPWWINQITAYCFLTLVGYLLIRLNNQFTIITQRATIQSTLYLLFVASIPQIHMFQPSHLATLCFLLCTYSLFYAYKDSDSMYLQFYGGVFASMTFLAIPKLILLLPLVLISKIIFNNLNIRTFLASLLGFILPLWFLAAHALWHDQLELLYYPFKELISWNIIHEYSSLELNTIATFIYFSVVSVISSIYLLFSEAKMRVRTRHMLNHLNRLSFGLVLIAVFSPKLLFELIPIWTACISLIYGYVLVTIHNKLTNLIFISSITLLTALFVYNLWTL